PSDTDTLSLHDALPICSSSNGPATVTVMTWESADTNKAIDAALQKFMQQNPKIKVERIASPNSDYAQKLSSLVVAKKLPDIFWADRKSTRLNSSHLGIS